MPDVDRLARAAQTALAFVQAQPGVIEAEVFVADNRSLVTRLNYTSHIPCNGVEEPKSTETYGIGLQASFESPDGVLLGFGSEPSDLSTAGVARALEKARGGAVERSGVPLAAQAGTGAGASSPTITIPPSSPSTTRSSWRPDGRCSREVSGGFLASSRLAELAASDEELRQTRPDPGRRRHHPAGVHGHRLERHARAADRRVDASHELRHRHDRDARCQGLRMVHGHAARRSHRRGGGGGGATGRRGHGRRARAQRGLHGDLRPPARDRSHDQPRRTVLPGGILLRFEHAVSGQARQAGRLSPALHLRRRRPARAHGLQGHHVRGTAHRAHRSDPGRRARGRAHLLVRRAASAPRSRDQGEARGGRSGGRRPPSSRAMDSVPAPAAAPSTRSPRPPPPTSWSKAPTRCRWRN